MPGQSSCSFYSPYVPNSNVVSDVAAPLILRLGILQLPFNKLAAVHKKHWNLRLMACHLSENSIHCEEFRKNLSKSCVHLEDIPLNLSAKSILKNGYISVTDGIKIPCHLMN